MLRQISVSLLVSMAFSLPIFGVNASDLPEGGGQEVVEGVCTACHRTNQITRSRGYTVEGWRELIATMIDLSELPGQNS